jgi:hypothetical protein
MDRLVGVLLALIGVAVAIVALIALQRPGGRQAGRVSATVTVPRSSPSGPVGSARSTTPARSSTPPTSTSSTSASTPRAAADSLPIVVLNNSARSGAENVAKQQIEEGGWTVSSVGTLDDRILSTCLYYDPSNATDLAEAQRLQQQFSGIKRIAPKFSGLPAGPLVLVLTSDFTG